MSIDYNKVILLGNVLADPEILANTNDSSESVAHFALVTSYSYVTRKNERKVKKSILNISVFSNNTLVKIIESRVRQGSKVLVDGSIEIYEKDENIKKGKCSCSRWQRQHNSDQHWH